MIHLKVQTRQFQERPLEFEFEVAPEQLGLEDEYYRFINHVTGRIEFQFVERDVEAKGIIFARIEGPCVRCLAPAKLGLEVPVREFWLHQEREEQIEDPDEFEDLTLSHRLTGEEIELDEIVRELIMADLPERPLCSPDCKGLCPDCGVNVNREPCRCGPATVKRREEKRLPEWKRAIKQIKLGG